MSVCDHWLSTAATGSPGSRSVFRTRCAPFRAFSGGQTRNSALIEGDVAQEVQGLKAELDGDLISSGGGRFARFFVENQLLDRCWLVIRKRHPGGVRIHLDTDLGGDTDDACALVMLLGWPDVEITGVTTVADPDGRRAAYVAHLLRLAGRADIPVVAGSQVSLTTLAKADPVVDDARHWPTDIAPLPSPPGAALDLLGRSLDGGATLVAIGPYTNLALLEVARAGSLARQPVVVMGGWVYPPAPGLPQWGPEMDFNVQWDTRAAEIVFASARLTLVTLPVTLKTHLRAADLPRLGAAGQLGQLLARQGKAHGLAHQMEELGREHVGLPDDLVNFQYDPVACAVAVGWSGATTEEVRLRAIREGDVLSFRLDPMGRLTRVVVDVDSAAFDMSWMSAIESAGTQSVSTEDRLRP